VSKCYGGTVALQDCSLVIGRNEFVSLLGPSGSGKTTILRIVGGFISQDSGTVRIHGKDVTGQPPNKRPVNTVFQNYALFPHRTVVQNVLFPLEVTKVPRRERHERAAELLQLVGLAGAGDRPVTQLSGGQAQRVALARALASRPEVLLLDEPLSALDLKLRQAMQMELRRIQEQTSTTFVYVTHDQGEALAMSDRVVLLDRGRVVQDGPPQLLYDEPATPFASDFLGAANLILGTVTRAGDGSAELTSGELRITGRPTADFEAGQPAVLSVRPERVRIGAPAGQPSCQLRGTIRRVIFLGHLVRCQVEVAPEAVITAEATRDAAAGWEAGEQVIVAWHPQDALMMPGGSTGRPAP
jgi:spermidine/putrescine transport system ATP-binding protein